MKNKLLIYLLVLIIFSNCKKDNTTETQDPSISTGKLKIEFAHTIENQTVQLNANIYLNEAGNHYQLTDLMYFISDLKLYTRNGVFFPIDDLTAIHYVDINIPTTLTWNIYDPIPTGMYDSISFIYGLNENRNQSNTFINPPESNMAWPDILGGGYHYMMMNGKWVNLQGTLKPFNFHLGIGQIYTDTINYDINTITSFVQNYFKVTLPLSNLQISKDKTTTIKLNMAIDSWYKTPHNWDFNNWGGNVMQNQHALQTIKENGFDVFTIMK